MMAKVTVMVKYTYCGKTNAISVILLSYFEISHNICTVYCKPTTNAKFSMSNIIIFSIIVNYYMNRRILKLNITFYFVHCNPLEMINLHIILCDKIFVLATFLPLYFDEILS